MSILLRSDGIQFVMQAYRERLLAKKKSHLIQEIRLLSEQRGFYLRLFNHGQGHYDAVFSMEPGYLLGESIFNYFNKTENLIYCEALPDSAHVLLVVVRQKTVCMDSKILAANLQAELTPLMSGNRQYRIVTVGNVPLRKGESFGTFRFPKDLIESFETLNEPLFSKLPVLQSLQLLPLPLALKSERPTTNFLTSSLLIFTLLLGISGVWWLAHAMGVENSSSELKTMATSSPAPDRQILEMIDALKELYFLPGWQVKKIIFDQGKYHVFFISDGGEISFLQHWAQHQHCQFHLSAEGIEFSFRSHLSVHPHPAVIFSFESIVVRLVDGLNTLLQDQAVSVNAPKKQGTWQETEIMIHLNDTSLNVLDLLSRELTGLPVKLNAITLHLHSGLMSGTIQLSVWGK